MRICVAFRSHPARDTRWLRGSVWVSQAEGRGFETRRPLPTCSSRFTDSPATTANPRRAAEGHAATVGSRRKALRGLRVSFVSHRVAATDGREPS